MLNNSVFYDFLVIFLKLYVVKKGDDNNQLIKAKKEFFIFFS